MGFCKDCSCGKKEKALEAIQVKKENSDRIVIYDVEEESGSGSCPSSLPLVGEKEYDSENDPANKLNDWIFKSGLDVVTVKVKQLDNFFALPEYKDSGAAGMDLYAAEDIFAPTSAITLVPTGMAMEIPEGYEAQVRPRSGLAINGVMVANSPGTIDSSFRGQIQVIIANFGHNTTEDGSEVKGWQIKRGDRIAQIVFAPVTRAVLQVVEALNSTERGTNGFGSTGIR